MAEDQRANAEFVKFSADVPKDALPVIAQLLNKHIRDHARTTAHASDEKLEAALNTLFHLVSVETGRNAPDSLSDRYFTQMVKNWVKKGNPQTTFLLETYFYLHRSPEGRHIAREIDEAIFGGEGWFDERGQFIPANEQAAQRLEDPVEAAPQSPEPEPSSNSTRVWDITKAELSIPRYRSFLNRYPDAPEAEMAQTRIMYLELWAAIPQSNPFAVRQFIEAGSFFPALGELALQTLDEAKAKYVEEHVERVRKELLSVPEPPGFLGSLVLATGFVSLWGLVAFLMKASRMAVAHPNWPFPGAAGYISGVWAGLLRGGGAELLKHWRIDPATLPTADAMGIGFQVGAVFVIFAATVAIVLVAVIREIRNDLRLHQQTLTDGVRAYHLDKVKNI